MPLKEGTGPHSAEALLRALNSLRIHCGAKEVKLVVKGGQLYARPIEACKGLKTSPLARTIDIEDPEGKPVDMVVSKLMSSADEIAARKRGQ